jgi:hypothetical protein
VQHITVKFLTNENMKPAEILMRLKPQFSDEIISRAQVYAWRKSFKEGWKEVENV